MEIIEKMLKGDVIHGEEVAYSGLMDAISANDRTHVVDYADIMWGTDTHTLYLVRVLPSGISPDWYYLIEDTHDGYAIVDGPYGDDSEFRAEILESTMREIERKIDDGEHVEIYAWNEPPNGNGCAWIELYRGRKGTLRAKVYWGIHPRKQITERPTYHDVVVKHSRSDDDYDYGTCRYNIPRNTVAIYYDAVIIGQEKLDNWEVDE